MDKIYEAYYSIINDENCLIFESNDKTFEAKYKFKFSILNGAESLSQKGKKALDTIKNIIESSDNGKLQDLINLKIEDQLSIIENSFGNIDDDTDESNKDKKDKDSSNDDELAENDSKDKDKDSSNDDELAE